MNHNKDVSPNNFHPTAGNSKFNVDVDKKILIYSRLYSYISDFIYSNNALMSISFVPLSDATSPYK